MKKILITSLLLTSFISLKAQKLVDTSYINAKPVLVTSYVNNTYDVYNMSGDKVASLYKVGNNGYKSVYKVGIGNYYLSGSIYESPLALIELISECLDNNKIDISLIIEKTGLNIIN